MHNVDTDCIRYDLQLSSTVTAFQHIGGHADFIYSCAPQELGQYWCYVYNAIEQAVLFFLQVAAAG